jgi:serine/threonine protein kinase
MPAPEDALLPPPGAVIDGKYRIEQPLGKGGMGVVVRALHLRLNSPVALKFLRPNVVRDPVAVARFTREALSAARLTSEHVARVYDIGALPDGAPFIVLEYLEGETLGEALQRTGPMAPSDACAHMVQLCDALAEAHAKGIIHRDLKLANLFLTARPNGKTVLKVLDFGISKLMTEGPLDDITATNAVLGTPAYMAPEQLQGTHAVDPRADLWSAGVCLFRLLTGMPPFDAETLANLVLKVLTQDAPSVLTHRPELPPGLAAVVKRCLEREPTARYSSASELAEALTPYLSVGMPRAAPVTGPQQLRVPTPFAATLAIGQPPAPPMTRRIAPGERPHDPPTQHVFSQTQPGASPAPKSRVGLLFGAVLALTAAAGLGALALRRHAPTASSTSERVNANGTPPKAIESAPSSAPPAVSATAHAPPPVPSAPAAAAKRAPIAPRRTSPSATRPSEDAIPDER